MVPNVVFALTLNAASTSASTSNRRLPMQGPSQTTTSAAALPLPWHSAASVASSTPPDSPRQPACAAATAHRQQHRQAVGHLHRAGHAAFACPGGIGWPCGLLVAYRRAGGIELQYVVAVDLMQPSRSDADCDAEAGAVGGHCRSVVSHCPAEVEAGVWRRAKAPEPPLSPRRHIAAATFPGADQSGRSSSGALTGYLRAQALRNSPWERPGGSLGYLRAQALRNSPWERPGGSWQRHHAAASGARSQSHCASGQCSGRVRSKVSSQMQASKTRIACGTLSSRQSKRCALTICGASTQSASVGVSPWQ